MNRGKRSVTVDLKHPEGAELVRRLAKVCDVLLTNYRIGVLDRLGLGFEELKKANPRIVFAQGSSWGPRGPWVQRPSRDILAQAASGIVAKGGRKSDPPMPAPFAVADQSGGLSLAAGILAALFARERTRTGAEGRRLDLRDHDRHADLRDGLRGLHGRRAGARRGRSSVPARGVGYVPNARRARLLGDRRRQALARVLPHPGIQHLENDPDLAGLGRLIPGDKMEQVLVEIFPKQTSRDWLAQFHDADILATEVVDYTSIMASEQARVNGYVVEVEHEVAGKIAMTGAPISLNGEVRGAAPPAARARPTHRGSDARGRLFVGDIVRVRDSGAV